jgi:hypothetical protein
VLAARSFGTESTLLKVGLASIVDFVIQGILGLFSFGSGVALVIHLTNAFLLAVIVTYLISFADSADKASTTLALQTKTAPSGNSPRRPSRPDRIRSLSNLLTGPAGMEQESQVAT